MIHFEKYLVYINMIIIVIAVGINMIIDSIIHHLILCRPDFPFFNAVCLGWLQCFPSKEVLSFKFLHEYFTPAVSYG